MRTIWAHNFWKREFESSLVMMDWAAWSSALDFTSPAVAVAKSRAFKTSHFSKAASKQGISDVELCKAITELDQGQGDNLGGNVWKKRVNKNLSRSIVLTKPAVFWVFIHLFEKQDKDDLAINELRAFKKLAKDFGAGGIAGVETAKQNNSLEEICHDRQ